jgi:hypothetical protein
MKNIVVEVVEKVVANETDRRQRREEVAALIVS